MALEPPFDELIVNPVAVFELIQNVSFALPDSVTRYLLLGSVAGNVTGAVPPLSVAVPA
jgi:hypothetical protein